MDYVLEIKEDAMLQQRIIGNAEISNLIIKFQKKDLTFSNDIIFLINFKEIIKNFDSNNKCLLRKFMKEPFQIF